MKLRYRDTHEYKFQEYDKIFVELEGDEFDYIDITETGIDYSRQGQGVWLSFLPFRDIGELINEIKCTDIFQLYIGFKIPLFNGYFFSITIRKSNVKAIHLGKSRHDLYPSKESHNEPENMMIKP